MMLCPCCSQKSFDECCAPFLRGDMLPETAEAFMRSRYTAFTRQDMDYLVKTIAPESRDDFNLIENKKWAEQVAWKKLNILKIDKGGLSDKTGTVEFIATYKENDDSIDHHEVAQFRKNKQGHWLFYEGEGHTHKEGEGHHHHHQKQPPVVREGPKVGRNDPCPCGSGKKLKKCCEANA